MKTNSWKLIFLVNRQFEIIKSAILFFEQVLKYEKKYS